MADYGLAGHGRIAEELEYFTALKVFVLGLERIEREIVIVDYKRVERGRTRLTRLEACYSLEKSVVVQSGAECGSERFAKHASRRRTIGTGDKYVQTQDKQKHIFMWPQLMSKIC